MEVSWAAVAAERSEPLDEVLGTEGASEEAVVAHLVPSAVVASSWVVSAVGTAGNSRASVEAAAEAVQGDGTFVVTDSVASEASASFEGVVVDSTAAVLVLPLRLLGLALNSGCPSCGGGGALHLDLVDFAGSPPVADQPLTEAVAVEQLLGHFHQLVDRLRSLADMVHG